MSPYRCGRCNRLVESANHICANLPAPDPLKEENERLVARITALEAALGEADKLMGLTAVMLCNPEVERAIDKPVLAGNIDRWRAALEAIRSEGDKP